MTQWETLLLLPWGLLCFPGTSTYGTGTDIYTNTWTLRLLDQLGPGGRVGENRGGVQDSWQKFVVVSKKKLAEIFGDVIDSWRKYVVESKTVGRNSWCCPRQLAEICGGVKYSW